MTIELLTLFPVSFTKKLTFEKFKLINTLYITIVNDLIK